MKPCPAESVYVRTEADIGPTTPVRRRRRPRVPAPGGLCGGRATGIGKLLNDVGSQLVRRRQGRVPRPGSPLFHVAEQDECLFHRLQGRGEVLAISQSDRRGGAVSQAYGGVGEVCVGFGHGRRAVDRNGLPRRGRRRRSVLRPRQADAEVGQARGEIQEVCAGFGFGQYPVDLNNLAGGLQRRTAVPGLSESAPRACGVMARSDRCATGSASARARRISMASQAGERPESTGDLVGVVQPGGREHHLIAGVPLTRTFAARRALSVVATHARRCICQ